LLIFITQAFNDIMFTPNINKQRLKYFVYLYNTPTKRTFTTMFNYVLLLFTSMFRLLLWPSSGGLLTRK